MTIQEWKEKAFDGGYSQIGFPEGDADLHVMLLSVEAWKAVGKVEGWKERCMDCDGDVTRKETPEYPNLPNGLSWCDTRCPRKMFMQGWHHKMHLMITALAEGKSIEEFLETL